MNNSAVLRLGRSNFVNVIPVHRHLQPQPALFQELPDVPSRLNRLLRQGQVDVGEVSSVEFARGGGQYLILPDLGLSTTGPVHSVLLLSRLPMEQWRGGYIEAPFESETSVALLRVFMKKLWGLDCRLLPEGQGGAQDGPPVALLRIGDRAIRASSSGQFSHVWDFGQVWQDWIGLPFVYALWVARLDSATAHPGPLAALHQALLTARDQGLADLEGCASQASAALGGDPAFYRQYFQALHYHLGAAEQQGLARFYHELHQAGVLAEPVDLRFFRPGPAVGD
ncbi:MAG: menaquinone biosynthesis protein [Pseudomonadota bacterium]